MHTTQQRRHPVIAITTILPRQRHDVPGERPFIICPTRHLALLTGEFDPTARGHAGIADESSDSRAEAELSIWSLGAPALDAAERCAIASPLSRVASVETYASGEGHLAGGRRS